MYIYVCACVCVFAHNDTHATCKSFRHIALSAPQCLFLCCLKVGLPAPKAKEMPHDPGRPGPRKISGWP